MSDDDNVEIFYFNGQIEPLKAFLSSLDLDFPVRMRKPMPHNQFKYTVTVHRTDGVIHLLSPGDTLVYDFDDNSLHSERLLF